MLTRVSFGPHPTGFLQKIHSNACTRFILQRVTYFLRSSRYGFINVRPKVIAFETVSRQTEGRERDIHRRLSMTGERRRLAVTFPVKFSMQGQAQWSAAFLRDGYCTVTANLQLWNRSITAFVAPA
jgi:hypothetical protein